LKSFPEDVNSIGGKAITASRSAIIRNHQAAHITPHYRKSVENTLRFLKDNDGIWRSKGRIGNSSLNSDAKSPIFISPKTPLATLIINEAHGEYHQGIEHTMSTIRMKYWIPRLRQQVRHTIKACVKCRRFNSLPYEYSETTDLPHRRVLQTRTFQHFGLDFFDLPLIKEDDKDLKTYGCIFTCTVTRLNHLELVKSMAVEDFLNALRRFIARREVEACLNSRPLTYQGAEQNDYSSIRPIDFIQRDMDVILPHNFGAEDSAENPEYALPERLTALKTRKDAERAPKSSCKYTERFRNIWQNHYLTSLRETHTKYVSTKRHHSLISKAGSVVLINDPVLPRNDWKMARITGTRLSSDGKIREVELITATKRKIKRPFNLITPLEIIDDTESLENANKNGSEDENTTTVEQRRPYNLRPRRPISYADDSAATLFERQLHFRESGSSST
uniref:Integrase_H2C2 domain-containing protein n=1 Tax=Heligmosomoides polygyrus TaxID=6339 RepID=A0A183FN61_HELPZ